MRFLLRADAGVTVGTGHVMRSLTLAEELTARGHEVELRGELAVPWLVEHATAVGIVHVPALQGALDVEAIAAVGWDAVVIDSYGIDPGDIGALNERTPVLAVIDEDDRGIDAGLYLDQNLGAEMVWHPESVSARLLAGSRYALVRRAIRDLRRDDRWRIGPSPHVLAFVGGSDPLGSMPVIAESLRHLDHDVRLTLIATPRWSDEVARIMKGRPGTRVIGPTSQLHAELAEADVVVSAAGTSAWDIGTVGLPAVFAAIVDNQRAGLRQIVAAEVALGLDASDDPAALSQVGGLVSELLADEQLRHALVTRSLDTFDGLGAARVVDALERLGTTGRA